MQSLRKNWYLILIGLSTVILGVIAVFTAIKIYQEKNKPVAPTAPESKPQAQQATPSSAPTPSPIVCKLTFNLLSAPTPTATPTRTATPTVTPTASVTPTATPTATPTPLLGCYHTCTSDSDCEGDLKCQTVAGSQKCVTPQCPDERDCICNKSCWEVCGQNSECPTGTTCRSIDGIYRCVNPSCDREKDCDCSIVQNTPTPQITPVSEGELPSAGTNFPTLGFLFGGAFLILIPLLLAL